MRRKTHYFKRRVWLPIVAITFIAFFNVQANAAEAALADSSLVKIVANEMAHALIAHECGKLRQPRMTAGYESGVYMSMNKLSLPKSKVTQILMQDKVIALTDTVWAKLIKKMDQGLTNCDEIYKYVVRGLMPRLDVIGKQ
jgi:hypothetical protein